MTQKTYKAPSGTLYTQVNDSTYDWNGSTNGYGTIHINPTTGAYGTYHVQHGSAGADTEHLLSDEYLQKHLNNINNGTFEIQPSLWDDLKKKISEKWNPMIQNLSQKLLIEKQGGKAPIHIKKKNRGKFTDYCGGKVTSECIARGKNSPNPTIRKRATFAANARKWKHQEGGLIIKDYSDPNSRKYFSTASSHPADKYKDLEKYLYFPELNDSEKEITEYISSSKPKLNYSGYTLLTTNHEDLSNDLKNLITLFNKYNARVRITSGYRKDAKTSNGSKSHHSTGMAIDIVPEDGNFIKLAALIKNTPEISNYMKSKGLGVLDETTSEMIAKTGATGKHFHIGPDKLALNFWLT